MQEDLGSSLPHEAHFLPDGTPTGPLLRDHDWAASKLGHPTQWPRPLRATATLMLDSPVAMWLGWGAELNMVYNAPYAQLLGDKHPGALGAPLREVWSEIWPDVDALVAATLSGQALFREDMPLQVNRQGRDEQAWFTFSYSPLRDDSGAIRGLICTAWETTHKVLAIRRIAESESRLKALALASTNVIYRMSADWNRMLELNGQGFVADTTAPSTSWADNYIHPDDRPIVDAAIQHAIRTRSKFELEHRVTRMDGTLGWTLSRAIPVLDETGSIVEWLGTATDITSRRAAQQALEETNRSLELRLEEAVAERKLFATIVDSTDAMVQVADLDGRCVALNRAARSGLAAVYGVEPRIGDNVLQRLGPADNGAWAAAWRAALEGKESTTLVPSSNPDRRTSTYEVRFSNLRDGAGHAIGGYLIATDVTARLDEQRRLTEAESALRHATQRETEERYRLAVLATNDAIWDWRLADAHVVWNKALTTLFGHDHDQTSADWWLEHIHPDDRSRVEASIHAVIDGGGTAWSEEYRFRRADGSYADIFDRGTVLRDDRGHALRMIGAMLDLTERKTAAAALRESERKFRTLFDSIDEGFCVIEFLDGPHGPLSDYVHVSANPAYTANAGIPDVVGQRVRDMVP
ncbi:MAG: PAS domain-containing protein, partial [Burkholderiales bacterium]|nr:PAS domain-containing protein [Burkholderiales bacterium]